MEGEENRPRFTRLSARGGNMIMTRYLPDGGQLDITDDKLVPMGDVKGYRQITYMRPGSHNQPACEIVFEIRHGVPVCASVHISADDDEAPVRTKDLKAIHLEKLRDDVYAYVGVWRPNPNAPKGRSSWVHESGTKSYLRDRKTIERAVQRRRRITPEFLKRVAELHNSAPAGSRLDTVCAAFEVRERQALRYIRLARDKGLIDG
jgi:hypothetical protein